MAPCCWVVQVQVPGPAAWIVAASSLLAVAGALWARETHKTPLRELGNPVT